MNTLLEQPDVLSRMVTRLYPHTFAEHMSDGEWKAAPHHAFISKRIAEAISRGRGRMLVTMPPGHGKSELISHWTPVWFLENLPRRRVILTSYGADLAEDWGRKVRDEFQHNPLLATKLNQDSTSVSRWHTQEGGEMVAGGVGGPLIGRRGHLIIIDDPIKNWEDAYSPTKRRKVVEWFNSALYTRAEPGATIIILLHRWHSSDLAGYLTKEHGDKWETISLPAIAEAGDMMGRKPGEALWPERYDENELALTKTAVGDPVWSAMYQQRPTSTVDGRVYEKFTPQTFPAGNIDDDIALRNDLDLHLSIDFNVNPGMHMIIGQYDSRRDCFYAWHEVHGPRMKTEPAMKEFLRVIKECGGWKWPRLMVFGDRSGYSENTTTTDTDYTIIMRMLREAGISFAINVPRQNPPVKERIDAFNDALRDIDGVIHYTVHPRCKRLIADFETLLPDEAGLIEKSDKKLSHASDAEGYRIKRIRPMQTDFDMGPQGAIINKGASS